MSKLFTFFLSALVLSFAFASVSGASVIAPGTGPVETLLYSFGGKAGGEVPESDLIADTQGALYGTTALGGARPCNGSQQGCGVVYKLTPDKNKYTESVLYTFGGGSDGNQPAAGLVADASGALYGTTSFGGSSEFCGNIPQGTGCGTVFKLTPTSSGYVETVLHRFTGADGAYPLGDLVIDSSGALYGTTWLGGNGSCHQLHLIGCGTVFKLTPNGSTYKFDMIQSFAGGDSDGERPAAAVLLLDHGVLLGTTEFGAGHGTVFALTPSGKHYKESILFRFTKAAQGFGPISALVMDRKGALYGTAISGQQEPGCTVGSRTTGCGVVYKLTPKKSGYVETVIHQFLGGGDGFAPAAAVTLGKNGALFGTTFAGGGGAGTVYELTPSSQGYTETLLATFQDNFQKNNGAFPSGALILDKSGNLYGTTGAGGDRCLSGGGCGVVFRLTP